MSSYRPPLYTPGTAALDSACTAIGSESAAVATLAGHGCTVTPQQFNRWRRGLARPDEAKWPALYRAFAIQPHLWLTDAARDSVVAVLAAEEASR